MLFRLAWKWCLGSALFAAGLALILPPSTAAAAGTRPAAPPSTAAAELYSQILDHYLTANWTALPADLAKTKDLATLTKDQQADVAYIKQAVIDGRPAWWDAVKQQKKINLATRLWDRNLNTTFDPSLDPGLVNVQQTGTQTSVSLSWLVADMDNPAQAEHGFTKGDLSYVGIWSALETAQLYASLQMQRLAALDQAGKMQLNRFLAFRGSVAAAYYGTPRARRWAAFLACDAYAGAHLNSDGFIPRRPLAVFLEEEIVSHPAKYPSLRLPRNQKPDTVEATLAVNLMGQFERTTLSFPEDKALRDALRDFAGNNGTPIFTTGKVLLPSKLTIPLNPADDADGGATTRGQWLIDEIAHPGIHAEQATKPAPKPATKP